MSVTGHDDAEVAVAAARIMHAIATRTPQRVDLEMEPPRGVALGLAVQVIEWMLERGSIEVDDDGRLRVRGARAEGLSAEGQRAHREALDGGLRCAELTYEIGSAERRGRPHVAARLRRELAAAIRRTDAAAQRAQRDLERNRSN